ncbi:MAG: flagellar hook-associated protein FlgL [Pseudomonadales bacterium]|jgi:flagellar hook-associated protein 3 FlgL|nr:flagellar hook-associated protein FlgL [Pseudomonadales bacterium]
MRVSSFQIHTQASEQLQTLGAQTALTQQQIGEGKKLVRPGDDPVGAARVIGIKQELGARDQFVRNTDAADVQLSLEESTLAQVTELIQRVQELTLQAGSGVQTQQDRAYIAAEISARFDELMSLANSRNSSGQYLFSGFKGAVEPFSSNGNEVVYQGDAGQRKVQIDRGQFVAINDSGEKLFMQVPIDAVGAGVASVSSETAGISDVRIVDRSLAETLFPDKVVIEFNSPADAGGVANYTVKRQSDQRPLEGLVNIPFDASVELSVSGVAFAIQGTPVEGDQFIIETTRQQSLFQTVKGIADGLVEVDAATDPEAFRNLIDTTIAGLEGATDVMLEARADIGARFNSLTAAKNLHEDVSLQLQTVRSSIEDLDFAKAISDLAYQSFVLEAAQQSFVRINNLSLFNRL